MDALGINVASSAVILVLAMVAIVVLVAFLETTTPQRRTRPVPAPETASPQAAVPPAATPRPAGPFPAYRPRIPVEPKAAVPALPVPPGLPAPPALPALWHTAAPLIATASTPMGPSVIAPMDGPSIVWPDPANIHDSHPAVLLSE